MSDKEDVEGTQITLAEVKQVTEKREEGIIMKTKLEHMDTPFEDKFEFSDDVHGMVLLNQIERDVIDTPEFQRLFRLLQLGFVDLVYHNANHTRGSHSIGTCYWAKKLVDTLNENNKKLARFHIEPDSNIPQISKAERVLISLGSLLHDISHGPFSHDIEKKTIIFILKVQMGSVSKFNLIMDFMKNTMILNQTLPYMYFFLMKNGPSSREF